MTLKDQLENDFGVELPISDGFGNTIENSIIILRNENINYVGAEH